MIGGRRSRCKRLGAAVLLDHAEGSSVLFGQRGIALADPLLDVEGKNLTQLRMDGQFEPKSIQILYQHVYPVGTLSLVQPLLTALLTALINLS